MMSAAATNKGKIIRDRKAQKKAVEMLAAGEKQVTVANALGVSPSAISQWRTRDEIREWIEREATRYVEKLPDALKLSHDLVDAAQSETDKARDGREANGKIIEIGAREAEKILKAAGILPTHTLSVAIQNIYNDNHASILSPAVAALLEVHSRALSDNSGLIDVSPEDDE